MNFGIKVELGVRMKKPGLTLLSASVLLGCASAVDSSDHPYQRALESLTGAKVRSHIEILAADDMQGREAATAGHQKAAQYLASRFADFGLQPLGDNGTFFQHIQFLETRLVEGSASMVLHRGTTDVVLDYNALLSNSGTESIFSLAGRDLNELYEYHTNGGTRSFKLDVSASFGRRSSQRRVTSPNVLALLPGSDPDLRKEYVLFTAHLDHLGVRPGEDDEIYNGAYDNAAGVATVIELAGALAELSPAPRRSIIFAALTGEEKGLRGSDYLAHNASVGIESIVANINVDMPYLGHPIADVEGLGVEHSTLHVALIRATEQQNLTLTPDPRPELVRLIRSDQYSFVKQGVPGLNLKPGSRSSRSRN